MAGCSGEMLMSDDSVKPCAVKTVQYATRGQRLLAQLELSALKTALGVPGLVQCLGSFTSKGSDDEPILHIITE